MLLIGVFVISILIIIAWQDYKFRAVYWWLFALLFLGLWALSWLRVGFYVSVSRTGYNLLFVSIQILLLSAYFSLKQKRWVNIFKGYFGLGDLCFLLAISAFFPFTGYIMFYVLSLLMVIISTALVKIVTKGGGSKIPLAGYQSVFLAMVIIAGHFFPKELSSLNFLLNSFTA